MALIAARNERIECPELLLKSLVDYITFVLDVSVYNQSVFFSLSALNHLHARIKSIVRHGAKIKHYLIFSQKSYAAFDAWLENGLADHSLGPRLRVCRFSILDHYQEWAFFRRHELFSSLLDCLYALSTRDYSHLLANCPTDFLTQVRLTSEIGVLEMPIVGKSVLQDFEGDDLTTIRQAKPASSPGIPINTSRGAANASNGEQLKEEVESSDSTSVPSFSYALHASPVSITDLSDVPKVKHTQSHHLEPTPTRRTRESNAGAGKSFLESGGLIQPPAFGNFPLPYEGQSLTSFLSSLSSTMPELDRENAHFNVSEALISAFEKLKAKEQADDRIEKMRRIANEEMFESPYESTRRKKFHRFRRQQSSGGYTETEESEKEYWKQYPRRPPSNMKKRKKSNLSLGSDGQSESFHSTADATTSFSQSPATSEDEAVSSFSAENLALNLLRNTNIKNVEMSDASKLQWMVTEADAPQNLLPMPKNWGSSPEFGSDSPCGSIDSSMRLRGTTDWAPPRAQIIFTIHPPPNLHNLMEVQKYRCAGCGTKVEPKYAGTFRYCNYLGRYFCTGCHTLKKARLPQLILHRWDFSPYLVSNFSATFLESLHSDPVYNIMAINPNLLKKVRLNNFRNYRIQLGYLSQYLRNCKAATSLMDDLNKFPSYYASDVDLYSLKDLIELRFAIGLPLKTKEFVSQGVMHVLHCELCKQLGFVCEMCRKDEVIFPFQLNRVVRCNKCLSCFHLKCFTQEVTKCPKCIRLTVRNENISGVEIV